MKVVNLRSRDWRTQLKAALDALSSDQSIHDTLKDETDRLLASPENARRLMESINGPFHVRELRKPE